MKVAITRHNGIGDIVMSLPFALHLAKQHDVTYYTCQTNEKWITSLFPAMKYSQLKTNPYTDFRQSEKNYDILLNFNRLEIQDVLAVSNGEAPMNIQYLMAILTSLAGLDPPESWSPSNFCPLQPQKSGVLIFSEATSKSRTLGKNTVKNILTKFPKAVVNPRYKNKLELIENIAKADLVIASDTGTIHIAELVKTRWICLHTTFNKETRHKYYTYGRCIQSYNTKSPCFSHGGCAECPCTDEFNLDTL